MDWSFENWNKSENVVNRARPELASHVASQVLPLSRSGILLLSECMKSDRNLQLGGREGARPFVQMMHIIEHWPPQAISESNNKQYPTRQSMLIRHAADAACTIFASSKVVPSVGARTTTRCNKRSESEPIAHSGASRLEHVTEKGAVVHF